MADEPEQERAPLPQSSETVKRLRETFTPLAASLKPEDEPAVVYKPA